MRKKYISEKNRTLALTKVKGANSWYISPLDPQYFQWNDAKKKEKKRAKNKAKKKKCKHECQKKNTKAQVNDFFKARRNNNNL